ncbi:GvpL/GvpF family gas vesicle protein [Granulicella cerasi]|uniref:GvpL/GvpF family gas vesicle protein n=1 Tax=Granulicella cerasi TaxID=741063 RepID=UPI00295C1549|nr:GvpL/GvpF family gas vesicle protein [Granulicella cerasi]
MYSAAEEAQGATETMAWYAYCIAERSAFPELARHRRPMPLPNVTGLFGNQTFLFPAADLTVIVSEHLPEDTARLAGPEASAACREHANVIATAFKRSTVLPFRFATTFQDDDALRRSVRSNQRHFMANVERLRGKAEMHLKVLVDDVSNEAREQGSVSAAAGQQYLAQMRETASRQRERQSKARALTLQMNRMFLPLEEEITCKRMDSGKMLIDIAHLVDKSTVERYQNKYSTATKELKDLAMQLSGPWPPYHFVQRETRTHA